MDIPETRYAKTADGVHIAYQTVGTGPVDIAFVMAWTTHIELMWKEPTLARFLSRLAAFSRLIVFDKRGTGLSDRVPDDRLPSLEVRMDDARAVMDAVGSERAIVMGFSEGGPMATLFAATYPERTIALVLFGTSACWRDRRSTTRSPCPPTRSMSATSRRSNRCGVRGSSLRKNSGTGARPRLRTMTTRSVGSRTTFVTPRVPELRSRSSG